MISLIFPWRSDDGPRRRIFDWVEARYRSILPLAEVVYADSGDEPFNRSRSKNQGFASSRGNVVVIADADIMVDAGWLRSAVWRAHTEEAWFVPERCVLLEQEPTKRILNGPVDIMYPAYTDDEVEWEGNSSVGGCIVVNRAGYHDYDERFIGWGWEDAAFAMTMTTMWGPLRKLPGSTLYHLWHPKGQTWDNPRNAANQALFNRYQEAADNKVAMTQLLKERNEP